MINSILFFIACQAFAFNTAFAVLFGQKAKLAQESAKLPSGKGWNVLKSCEIPLYFN